jgi:hypothetical protein
LFFPVVLGTTSKHLGASSLNASRLTSLLAAQKDNITAALPSGFAELLQGTGLLGELSGAADKVSAAANQASTTAATATNGGPRAATAVTDQTSGAATTATRAASDARMRADSFTAPGSFNWLYWIIPALVLAALIAWFFASNRLEQVTHPKTMSLIKSARRNSCAPASHDRRGESLGQRRALAALYWLTICESYQVDRERRAMRRQGRPPPR